MKIGWMVCIAPPLSVIGGNENGFSLGELLRDWGFYMKRSVSVYKSVSDYQTVYENENEIDNLKNTETAKDTEAGDQNKPQFFWLIPMLLTGVAKYIKEISFFKAAPDAGII